MYSFLPSSATRAEPIDWTRLVRGALAVVQAEPSEQVSNALAIMQSYAAAAPSVFVSLARGARDTKEYITLLTALDEVVAAWPLRLRQLLTLPAVALVSAGGLGGSLLTVPVRTPRGEALVQLLNIALGHLENGLGYVARVRADAAGAASTTTPQGGSVAAPNQNAKIAVQHFRQAVEALQWADALQAAPASPSAVALQQLRHLLPLDVTQAMAVLCAAVARYAYALSSGSTKDKPEVLAKLAFAAAQLPLPVSVPSASSLQLLPSLLMAAYHYHKATWYYAHASSKGPEMDYALGHARYADALLRTCNAQWSVEEVHTEAEHESRQWWGRRLASLFSGSSSAKSAKDSNSGARAAGSRGSAPSQKDAPRQRQTSVSDMTAPVDGGDDDVAAPLNAATRYPSLHALFLGQSSRSSAEKDYTSSSPTDAVEVYPYARQLLHDVCVALQQYERENNVVYFAKVATAEEVRCDVPDVQSVAEAAATGIKTTAEATEAAIFGSRTALFASLPSPDSLQAALAKQEEVGQAQQALSRALQRVEKDARQLCTYVTPTAALEQALDALEALLPNTESWASPKAAVALAVDAVDSAFQRFKTIAADWQEGHDVYVGDRCPPPAAVEEAEREVLVWTERATQALTRWSALHVPATVRDRSGFVAALVPRSAEITAYLEQVEGMCRDVRDVLAAEPGTVTQDQVLSAVAALEKVKLTGTELMAAAAVEGRLRSRTSTSAATTSPNTFTNASNVRENEKSVVSEEEFCVAPHYEVAEAAVLAVVDVLQEAPMVVAHIEDSAGQLLEMQQRAVITPISHVRNVEFRDGAAKPDCEAGKKKNGGVDVVQSAATPRRMADTAVVAKEKEPAKPARRRITGLSSSATASAAATAAASSTASTTSRKRSRENARLSEDSDKDADMNVSPEESRSDGGSDSDINSVHSSQLGDAEEVAPAPEEKATRAAVSGSLLSRMKANKAKRQAMQSAGSVADSPPAKTKKAVKTEKRHVKR